MDEIKGVIQEKAQQMGLCLVLDVSQSSTTGTPVVLFSLEELDMTDEILNFLNSQPGGA